MKKKPVGTKLTLQTETLRALELHELAVVIGGAVWSARCVPPTERMSCVCPTID